MLAMTGVVSAVSASPDGVGAAPTAHRAGGGADHARTTGSRPTPTDGRAAAEPIRFSRMVVVDQQRPGFEPDVKVNSRGRFFTSIPFGFSTTSSFVWRSTDHGNTYQLVPGNVGTGKPSTCVGGGDTDLFIDPRNALYFSDLQGLSNISNSVSTDGGKTWSTNCAGAPNSPDDRMWFTGTGSLANGNLLLYQDFDQVGTSADPTSTGGNQLVETLSTNGTDFVPVINPNVSPTNCAGTAVDCVTDNEGISGNQVIDPKTGNVFIAHTSLNGNSQGGTPGVEVAEGKIDTSNPAAPIASWSESPNLDGALCPTRSCVTASGYPTELAGENFASIARDTAGYLYVTFTAGPIDHTASSSTVGQLTAPEQIYVVRSRQPATSSDPSTITWTTPQRITGPGRGISAGTNTFPWITAGTRGRIAVAYYHTSATSDGGAFGAANLSTAEWTVQVAQSLNAAGANPSYSHAAVSDGPIKYGQICTNGIGCATGGDRSLGDFLQVTYDQHGALLVSYVDDSSGNVQAGEDTGPEVISRQTSGPGLLAGSSVGVDGGPARAWGGVRDRTGDAYYSANGSRVSADRSGAPRLDVTAASLSQPKGKSYLVATLRTRRLKTIVGSANLGGIDNSWIMRWNVLHQGQPGNGLIEYVGVDNNGARSPTFFAGTTSCIPPANQGEHCKYLTYPQTTTIQGKIFHKRHMIKLFVPRTLLKLHRTRRLISVTAFTATADTPASATTIFNLIDATTPFDVHVRRP